MAAMTTSLAVCLAAAGLHNTAELACDKVDLVEVNHFYDEKGQLVYEQLIFYDWSPTMNHFNVRAYRLLKSPVQFPRRSRGNLGFVAVWQDGDVLRKIHAKTIRESWTQYDPEMLERDFLPKDQRRNLERYSLKRPRSTRAADLRREHGAHHSDSSVAVRR